MFQVALSAQDRKAAELFSTHSSGPATDSRTSTEAALASTEVTAEKLDATCRESVGLPPVSTSRDDAADEVNTSWVCFATPTTGSAVAVRDPRDHVHPKSCAKAGPEAAGSARVEVAKPDSTTTVLEVRTRCLHSLLYISGIPNIYFKSIILQLFFCKF